MDFMLPRIHKSVVIYIHIYRLLVVEPSPIIGRPFMLMMMLEVTQR